MKQYETVKMLRDCECVQIPYGNTLTLRQDQSVTIVHQLGDTFTVRTEAGFLVRIGNKDADALGKEIVRTPADEARATSEGGEINEELLWDQLRTCYDPEIPANIVDLGLIYECVLTRQESGINHVDVKMTLTAPGCGMGQVIKDDVERKLLDVPWVNEVVVELVFSPPWDSTMMSEAARLQLGMM